MRINPQICGFVLSGREESQYFKRSVNKEAIANDLMEILSQ